MDSVITLNLSRYFNDQRSYIKIYLDEKFKTVHDLQTYIKQIFNINGKLCLLDTSSIPYCLLPRSESINLLQGIRTHILVEPSSFKIPKCSNNVLSENCGEDTRNKLTEYEKMVICDENMHSNNFIEKINNAGADRKTLNSISTVNNPKDQSTTQDVSILKCDIAVRENGNNKNPENMSKRSSKFSQNALRDKTSISQVENSEVLKDESKSNTTIKSSYNNSILLNDKSLCKDAKRPQKNSNIIIEAIETINLTKNQIDNLINHNITEEHQTIDEDKNLDHSSHNHVTTRAGKRTRKRRTRKSLTPFLMKNDADNSLIQTVKESFIATPVSLKSTPSHIRFSEDYTDLPVNETTINESVSSEAYMSESNDTCKKPKIIENTQTFNESISMKNDSNSKTTWEKLYDEFEPHKYESIKMLPSMGDVIACKVLRMTSAYEPELSSYIFALVVNVDKHEQIQNSDLTLEILVGSEFLQEPSGKFQLPENEEDCSEVKIISLKWHNIYDPKFILK